MGLGSIADTELHDVIPISKGTIYYMQEFENLHNQFIENERNKAEWVKRYVAAGFLLFPLQGKIPCAGTRGFLDATNDLTKLLDHNPSSTSLTGKNIGIALGEASGVWVVDVDDLTLWRQFIRLLNLPRTWLQVSGTGKPHFFFRWDSRCRGLSNTGIKLDGGLVGDVKGVGEGKLGGYVVGSPSIHPKTGTSYKWANPPAGEVLLADCPDCLIQKLPKRQTETRTIQTSNIQHTRIAIPSNATRLERYLAACPPMTEGIGEGNHYAIRRFLIRVVGQFILPSVEDYLAALDSWNARCNPPWAEWQLRKEIESALQYVEHNPKEHETLDDILN